MAKGYKAASKKAVHESKVASLDFLGEDVGEFITKESMTVVEQVVGDFVQRVHQNINQEKGMRTTGSIAQIEVKAENNAVNVYAPSHLIYQDRGVNGSEIKRYDTPHSFKDKRPPVQPIIDWIKAKNIRLKDNHKFKGESSPFKDMDDDEKITATAWAISTKIFKEGFKPRHIYSKEIPKLVEDLQNEIADFSIQSLEQVIDINPRDGGKNRTIK